MSGGLDYSAETRILSEKSYKAAAAAQAANPNNADNLTRLGFALIKWSRFQKTPQGMTMMQDAMSKFHEALALNPKQHEALSYLGNAHMSYAFYIHDGDEAKVHLDKAIKFTQLALDQDPDNQSYRQSLKLTFQAPTFHRQIHGTGSDQQAVAMGPSSPTRAKAPELHTEVHKKGFGQQAMAMGSGLSSSTSHKRAMIREFKKSRRNSKVEEKV